MSKEDTVRQLPRLGLAGRGPNRIYGNLKVDTRLEDFSNRLNLRRVKMRVAALFLAQITPPTPTSAHFEALTAMLPALPSL